MGDSVYIRTIILTLFITVIIIVPVPLKTENPWKTIHIQTV